MKPRNLIDFLTQIEKLKCNTRHSWTSSGRHESVAEHSWRLAVMAYLVKDEFPDIDVNKLILMCLVHDFGEAITGDIPAFDKTEEHEVVEEEAIKTLLSNLPKEFQEELTLLFAEMKALETVEAKIYKALDNMETLLQHNEADISTWLPLEYEMNLTYGTEKVEFSSYMKELKKEINQDCINKMEEQN